MYMLAGHVAEKLGDATWEQLVQTKIFDPLGMKSTRIMTSPDHVTSAPAARPYLYENGTTLGAGTPSNYK
jgi:CubicO group peptidase (beta-lactamase class C family)